MKRRVPVLVAVGVSFAVAGVSGAGEPPRDGDTAALVKGWLGVCSRQAHDHAIYPAASPEDKFKLLPDPVFRHSQPVRGDDIGAVWLWVQDDGRPAAVADIFAFSGGAGREGYRFVAHEFHSLLDQPLVALWRGGKQWSTSRAGLTWQPVPGAPPPAASAAPRGRQIGDLARQFQAHEIDPKGGRWELRLVAKPMYRYQLKKTDAALDGALVAFCQGTDPEVILCIEARRTEDGCRWHYACAAFSDYELHVRHGDTEVWAAPRFVNNGRTGPHWARTVTRTRLPDESPRSKD